MKKVLLLVLLLAAPAQASTVVRPSDTSLPYAEWIAEAQVPTPDARVWVWRDDCPFAPEFTCSNGRTIWLTPAEYHLESAFFHELGHVFDLYEMRREDREKYRRLTGFSGRWRSSGLPSSGVDEQFANSYRDCAEGASGSACDLIRTISPRGP